MKKIEEFCKTLGDDALKNIELILNEIDKNIKNIKNIEYTYYLSNLLINECIKENVTNKEKYINLATFHRNKFVEYLAQKLNISQSYISRIEKKVIKKIKETIKM